MTNPPNDFARRYADLEEEELLALGGSYDALVSSAQAALRAEFARRNMEVPLLPDAVRDVPSLREFVTVARYRDLSAAMVARSLLESAGIAAWLRDENLVRLEWQISNFIGGIRLQVDRSEAEAASELLQQAPPEAISFDNEEGPFSQPVCPACGSSAVQFDGASRGAALASLYLLSIPLPPGTKTWSCDACHARWEDSDS